jgi:hypothetical protein
MRKNGTMRPIDRRKHDDDIAERVIGGVRTEWVRTRDADRRETVPEDPSRPDVPDSDDKQS